MREKLRRVKDYLGPYDYRAGFIYWASLIYNLSSLRGFTFNYEWGWERIRFFLIGLLIYIILGLPLYLFLRLSQVFWRSHRKTFNLYLIELWLGSLISLLAIRAGQAVLIPLFKTENFLVMGVFFGELIGRFLFALLFIAITHNRLKTLGIKLETTTHLNNQLKERYSQLIDSDEEVRTHASQLLHDRIQSKLMLSGARLTRISEVLSEEGKVGVMPIIKELEQIRSIDVREVSELLTPNLAGEGLIGACENLCREYHPEIAFKIAIGQVVEELDEEIKLGLYRIIEQGVINAIKHGPATTISISIEKISSSDLVLEVKDNGPGSSANASGTGTIVIDAWVSKLGGRKEIESTPGGGYALRVLIP
jgi:signal transduction histidine kinase